MKANEPKLPECRGTKPMPGTMRNGSPYAVANPPAMDANSASTNKSPPSDKYANKYKKPK